MNAYDEIKEKAAEAGVKDSKALVELILLITRFVGKSVAIEGETRINEVHRYRPESSSDLIEAHALWVVGNQMQGGTYYLSQALDGYPEPTTEEIGREDGEYWTDKDWGEDTSDVSD